MFVVEDLSQYPTLCLLCENPGEQKISDFSNRNRFSSFLFDQHFILHN